MKLAGPVSRPLASPARPATNGSRNERGNAEQKRFGEHGGSKYDLDPVLESVAAEELMRFDEDNHEPR